MKQYVEYIQLCCLTVLISILFVSMNAFSSVDIEGNYTCNYTSSTIVIDGVVNEPAWQKAHALKFYVPVTHAHPVSPTEGKALWDDKNLYVAFNAVDKDLWGTLTEHDSTTFHNDVLEIFFMPDPAGAIYYNIEINVLGAVFDAQQVPGMRMSERVAWNCEGIEFTTALHGTLNKRDDVDESWQLEVAIPFSSIPILHGKSPIAGMIWPFHLARYDYSVYLPEGKELSSCAPMSMVKFHHPPDWLKLHFIR